VTTLPVLTQAEADARYLCPPAAFAVLDIAPGTVRAWASAGVIRARAIGPRGARLYAIREVCDHAVRVGHRPRRHARSDAA
jgi:hypothetical protein